MTTELDPYQELVQEQSQAPFCGVCGHPVHGHFVCPERQHQARSLEGAPIDG